MTATVPPRGYSARTRRAHHALLNSIEPLEPRLLLANVVVNTLADENLANATTSLREAVAIANPADTVVFQAGLSGQITLGGSQIVINKNLNINGPGAATLSVSGNNASRIFQILAGVTVNIAGLRIQQGKSDIGGAIHNSGTLTLSNTLVADNSAAGANGDYAEGTDADGHDGSGGAVYTAGNLTINGGSFSGNTASGGAGGIVFEPTSVYGDGGDALGGAIYSTNAAHVTIASTTFTNNAARGGAGLSFTAGGAGGLAYGGAVYAAGNLAITGGTWSSNRATAGNAGDGDYDADFGGSAFGGAIWAGSSLSIVNASLNNNAATAGAGGEVGAYYTSYQGGNADGGAVYADTATSNITASTLNNNLAAAAENGGGGSASGGAVATNGGALTVMNSTLNSNRVVGTDSFVTLGTGGFGTGGAIAAGGTLNVSGSTLARNSALAGKGAAAYATHGGEIPAGDAGDARGGAIYAGGNASITRSTLFGNTLQGGDGGLGYDDVIWPAGDGGDARGAGVFANSALTLTGNTIAGNTATAGLKGEQGGGAVDGTSAGGGVSFATTLNIANTIVATNNAGISPDVSGPGGGFVVSSQGFNLIGKATVGGWLTSDKRGTTVAPLDPKLGALASNGGPTQTLLPLAGSPAIDAGKAFGLTTDQRGLPRTVNIPTVANAAGGDGTDIGAVELQSPQTPFKTFNIGATPITIQAEDFDNGGEGLAFHDTTTANQGGAYRSTAVDVQTTTDSGGGFNVGYTKAGEWLEYTVNVQTAGTYNLAFRLASASSGGKFHLEVDGIDKTGQLTVPNTGGWQTWQTITKSGVALPVGAHVLRLKMDVNGATGYVANFNYLTITKAATATTTIVTDTAAHVRDGIHANTNYGNTATLEVKKSTPSYNREAYLKFNLATISSIGSAKLRIFGSLDVAGSIQLGVYGSSNTGWSEGGLTWNTRNPAATATTALTTATISGTTAKWYELDVTSYLKAEKLAGRNTVTLVLKSSTTTTALATFAADGATNGPQLVVTS